METRSQNQYRKSGARKAIDYAPLTGRSGKGYKPVIHQTISLCILVAFTVGLLALTEYALRVLPHHQISSETYGKGAQKRQLLRRTSQVSSVVQTSAGTSQSIPVTSGPPKASAGTDISVTTPAQITEPDDFAKSNILTVPPGTLPSQATKSPSKPNDVPKQTEATSQYAFYPSAEASKFATTDLQTISIKGPPSVTIPSSTSLGPQHPVHAVSSDFDKTDESTSQYVIYQSAAEGEFASTDIESVSIGKGPAFKATPSASPTWAEYRFSSDFPKTDVETVSIPSPVIASISDPGAFAQTGTQVVPIAPAQSDAPEGSFAQTGTQVVPIAPERSDTPGGVAPEPDKVPTAGDPSANKGDDPDTDSKAGDQGTQDDQNGGHSAGSAAAEGSNSQGQNSPTAQTENDGDASNDGPDTKNADSKGEGPDSNRQGSDPTVTNTGDSGDPQNGFKASDADSKGTGSDANGNLKESDGGNEDTDAKGDGDPKDSDARKDNGNVSQGADGTKLGASMPANGKPFTSTISGKEVVITPFPQSEEDNEDLTQGADGIKAGASILGKPFTSTISGQEVVITPFPQSEEDNEDVIQGADSTKLGTSMPADGKPFTSTISGQEVVITPLPQSGKAIEDFLSGKTNLYMTTISGHQYMIASAPSDKASALDESGSGQDSFTTTIDGKEVIFGSGKPSKTHAVTASNAKAAAKATIVATKGSTTISGGMVEPTDANSYTESDVPLTFIAAPINYFYGVYFPVLLAVIYQILIGYLYTATKMMEPFAMLSMSKGISAKDFLWINYLAASDTFEPFAAMMSGHWLMLWVAIIYTMTQILSPLSSEMLGIYPGYYEVDEDTAVIGTSVWIHPQIARLVQGLLAVACIMLIGCWFLLRKYQSRIYSDPSSIAGIACLIHHPDTVQMFRSLSPTAAKEDVIEKLAGTRWRIGWYQGPSSSKHYGLILGTSSKATPLLPKTSSRDISPQPSPQLFQSRPSSPSLTPSTTYPPTFPITDLMEGKKSRKQLILNVVFALLTLGLLSLIIAYQFTTDPNNPFERFMDTQGFGPKFLLTSVGLILKMGWERLERRAVVFAPFNKLRKAQRRSKRGGYEEVKCGNGGESQIRIAVNEAESEESQSGKGASAHETVFATRTLIPITTLFTSLYRRAFIPGILAFTALLAECLVIVLPGIPFDKGQIYAANYISRYVTFGILGLMLLVMCGYWGSSAVAWTRDKGDRGRRGRETDDGVGSIGSGRAPNTLGAMIMYVAGTEMSRELAESGGRNMRRAEQEWGRREVELKRIRGESREERAVVDFVEEKEREV